MPKSGLCATRGYFTSDSMGRILAAATLMAISMINAAPLMPENALMPEKALSGKIDELVVRRCTGDARGADQPRRDDSSGLDDPCGYV